MARGRKRKNDIKRANGTGSIKKLSGNRRKPFAVLITTGYIEDEETLTRKQVQKLLGTYETRELANKALDEYNANPYDIDAENITFEEVYDQWTSRYFPSLKTGGNIRDIKAAFNHSKPLHKRVFKSITITDMRDTIEAAIVGPATKGRMKSMYNLMFDFAVEKEIVEVNKARNFTLKDLQKQIEKGRKSKKVFSEEDEKKLWDNLDFGFTRMVLIGIYSGWRPQELAVLERNNIDIENGTMRGGMKTNAGFNRIVPIHPKIKDLVLYYYKESEGQKFLFNDFNGQQGTYMTYDKYRGRFNKVMEKCGLEGFSPHCTRKTFVTKAKKYKVDQYAIKMIVGHEINDITERVYTVRDEKFLKEEILKIE